MTTAPKTEAEWAEIIRQGPPPVERWATRGQFAEMVAERATAAGYPTTTEEVLATL